LASLDRIEPLPVDLCLPGHGKPFRDPHTKIADVRAQAEGLLDKVRAGLAGGAEPTAFGLVEEIAGRDNLSAPTGGFLLQIVLACLDHLAALGEARQVPHSDPQRWRA
ncbi:MAG TPA: MBL fold metallo-hydrolase, partial [Solirubrobacterales bacterium]